jgi:predicted RNA methylase
MSARTITVSRHSPNLILTKEGEYSVSRPNAAEKISYLILANAKTKRIPHYEIVDATACNGGNTLSFTKNFAKVTAVEINPDNFAALRKNMSANGVREVKSRRPWRSVFKGLRLLCDDFTLCYQRFCCPIVFFDPPWGGRDYKTKLSIDLQLSGIDVAVIIRDMFKSCSMQMAAIKVPKNFNRSRFARTLEGYEIKYYSVENYYLVLVTA